MTSLSSLFQTAIIIATLGVIITTVSRPNNRGNQAQGPDSYTIGILLLTISSFLTGYLGLLQERTYLQYGRCWREGLFYTVSFTQLPGA
jgi:UDP-xylose/UDP-N-acetylglucosamine transporter B4